MIALYTDRLISIPELEVIIYGDNEPFIIYHQVNWVRRWFNSLTEDVLMSLKVLYKCVKQNVTWNIWYTIWTKKQLLSREI